jgi:hypothetical protein
MTDENRIMEKEEFFHFRVVNHWTTGKHIAPRGGVTVYYKPVTNNDGRKGARLAVTVCSPLDAYCKKTGREQVAKKMHAAISRAIGLKQDVAIVGLQTRKDLLSVVNEMSFNKWKEIQERHQMKGGDCYSGTLEIV